MTKALEKVNIIPDADNPVISMIERAASNPAVDIDKMKALLDMRKEERADEARRAFNTAMVAAQKDIRPVAADANNQQTRSKYASYFALDKVIRPIYSRFGFALSFDTGEGAPADHLRVNCDVMHEAGHTVRKHWDVPADGKGAKGGDVMTKTHASGAAFTYGQRYLLKAIFNIAIGEDDDGNSAGGETVSEEQLAFLRNELTEGGADLDGFLRFFKIQSLSALPARRYFEAVGMLAQKKAKK